jgi:hypothetical protein
MVKKIKGTWSYITKLGYAIKMEEEEVGENQWWCTKILETQGSSQDEDFSMA